MKEVRDFYRIGLPYEEECPYDPTNLECTDACKESRVSVNSACLMYGEDNIKR